MPLAAMAQKFDVPIIGVKHLNRDDKKRGLARIADSGAFAEVARSVLMFGRNPDVPEERIIKPFGNYIGDEPAIAYEIVPVYESEVDEELGERSTRCVNWLGFREDIDVSDVFRSQRSSDPKDERTSKLADARSWLKKFLADAARPASEILSAAEEAGFSDPTIKRAKKAAKVLSKKIGKRFYWGLPEMDTDYWKERPAAA
jgi:putative DNA primase/helicase